MSTNNKLLEESLVEAYVLYNWSYDSIVADYPNIEENDNYGLMGELLQGAVLAILRERHPELKDESPQKILESVYNTLDDNNGKLNINEMGENYIELVAEAIIKNNEEKGTSENT